MTSLFPDASRTSTRPARCCRPTAPRSTRCRRLYNFLGGSPRCLAKHAPPTAPRSTRCRRPACSTTCRSSAPRSTLHVVYDRALLDGRVAMLGLAAPVAACSPSRCPQPPPLPTALAAACSPRRCPCVCLPQPQSLPAAPAAAYSPSRCLQPQTLPVCIIFRSPSRCPHVSFAMPHTVR